VLVNQPGGPAVAVLGGVRAEGVVEHVRLDAPGASLDAGWWAVVGDFEGGVHAWRFARTWPAEDAEPDREGRRTSWSGPDPRSWRTSLDEAAYRDGVDAVRAAIREGDVYQVNLCRVLEAPLPGGPGREPDAVALAGRLAAGNPAPYGGFVHVPLGSVDRRGREVPPTWAVTASPELFLRVRDGFVASGPIKGTAVDADGLTAKDQAENVMITDLVRNDLQRACEPGTVEVTDLLGVEHHPGLVHLVTTVQGRLRAGVDWPALLAATYPPASVSGAPKLAALDVIRRLEPVPRGPYCGAIGWVDADAGTAELAVGIRTFSWAPDGGGTLRFGTGAGITWDSDAAAEWAETELKARRLVGLATRS
jgi:para-aminobenzoate synthetase component 1